MKKNKNTKIPWNYLFFMIVCFIYLLSVFFSFDYFLNVGKWVFKIFFEQILWVLVIVFIFMFVLNLVLKKKSVKHLIKDSKNSTKYIFSIIWWILSMGPAYIWYPFLKELKDNWLNNGHIATFIYARVVKIPFFAAMIFYFWLKYTIIFNLVLIFLAFLIWVLTNFIFWIMKKS